MAIKIGDTLFDAALAASGDRLTLTLPNTALPLDELAALFAPGRAPEVRVLDTEGLTTAIYGNRRVVEVAVRNDGANRCAVVALQIEPIEQGEADKLREQVALQAAKITQLLADSAAKDALIAAQQSALDTQEATIAELQRQIKEHEKTEALLKAQIQAMSDRGDFVEDVIAEMAMQVYQ